MLAFLANNKANLSNLIQLLPLIAQTIAVLPRVLNPFGGGGGGGGRGYAGSSQPSSGVSEPRNPSHHPGAAAAAALDKPKQKLSSPSSSNHSSSAIQLNSSSSSSSASTADPLASSGSQPRPLGFRRPALHLLAAELLPKLAGHLLHGASSLDDPFSAAPTSGTMDTTTKRNSRPSLVSYQLLSETGPQQQHLDQQAAPTAPVASSLMRGIIGSLLSAVAAGGPQRQQRLFPHR